ncbi:MAG: glutamyl-tRNA reductase, partial [Armatimonadetes bacterium]|nr:glutamyl-tRNA reductase [Armatimonadota bacterium]
MHLLLVGLNHETAPVEIRERVALGPKGVLRALTRLQEAYAPVEAALLSTCNRTEVVALFPVADPAPLRRFLEEIAEAKDLSPYLYAQEGQDAARHLFRVACGLDSMILGEGQILSQVRTALSQATEAGTLGGRLSALFRHAIETGKRARTETQIARGAASISNAAVHLARELYGDLRDNTALVLGAGETAELTLRLLNDAGVRSIIVANRTYDRAVALAETMNATVAPFDRLTEAMVKSDIVITSTGAPHAILRKPLVAEVIRKRRHRPLFLIDIAVPRDIEPAVNELDDVYLYNIDDLQQVVDETLGKRENEAEKVELIIEEDLKRFYASWRSLTLGPLLNALQERFEEIRLGEMEKSRRRLADLSESEREAVELLTRGILKRVMGTC